MRCRRDSSAPSSSIGTASSTGSCRVRTCAAGSPACCATCGHRSDGRSRSPKRRSPAGWMHPGSCRHVRCGLVNGRGGTPCLTGSWHRPASAAGRAGTAAGDEAQIREARLGPRPARPATSDGRTRWSCSGLMAERRHRAPRRPLLRRRPGDRGRLRDARRPAHRLHRPSEGRRGRGEHPAQLRHAPPGGLPQGDAPDATRRAARTARRDVRRHAGRLAGRGVRGAWPGGGHRPLHRPHDPAARPIVTVITGEGGSGGALAIAVGDVVLALENAIYSVISPEGCASILWRTPDAAQQAAVAMRLTARSSRPWGSSTRSSPSRQPAPTRTPNGPRSPCGRPWRHLERLVDRDPVDLVEARYARYRAIGAFKLGGRPPRHRAPGRVSSIVCGPCSLRRGHPDVTAMTARRLEPRPADRRPRHDERHDRPGRCGQPATAPRGDLTDAGCIQVERADGTGEDPGSLAELARVADELLPPLIARLRVSDLGELEVRQGLAGAHPACRASARDDGRGRGASCRGRGAPCRGQPRLRRDEQWSRADAPCPRPGSTSPDHATATRPPSATSGCDPASPWAIASPRGDVLGWVDVLGVRQESRRRRMPWSAAS